MKPWYLVALFVCCNGMNPERRLSISHDSHVITIPSEQNVFYEKQHHLPSEVIEQITPIPESESSSDSIPRKHHHKWLAITNSITGLISAAITAAVSLAIHFSNKCPTPPAGTP